METDLWQVVISSPTFPGVNHVGDVCLENQGGQKRDKGGVVWFGIGDIALPATGKAGCCLNMSFPVATLISEMQKFKI